MESKLLVAIVIIFAVTLLADSVAANPKLKEIRLEILGMKKVISDLEAKVLKPIADMEFGLFSLQIAVEEIQRRANATGAATIADFGSIDTDVVQEILARLNKQTEELQQIHIDLSNERSKRLKLMAMVENNSKLLTSQNDLIGTIETNIGDVNNTISSIEQTFTNQTNAKTRNDVLQRLKYSLKRAFHEEKKRLRHMSISLLHDRKVNQKQAKKEFTDFTEKVNKSVENFMDDMTKSNLKTTEHEQKLQTILKTMFNINETIAKVDTKVNQNEILLTDFREDVNKSVERFKDDIIRLENRTTEHDERMQTVLKKMDDISKTISDVDTKASQHKGCEQGWKQYLDECFIYKSEKLTWRDARRRCERLGGMLAEPETEPKNEMLLAMSIKAGDAGSFGPWLGGQKVNNRWQWASSRTAFRYTFWGKGEPSNYAGDENCLHFNERAWNDIRCYFRNSYFCQKAAA